MKPAGKTLRDDFDSPWKDLLQKYFPQFLEFFFPEASAGIDWSRRFEFLDKEFRQIVRDAKLGRRYADSLVRVHQKTGAEAWVLVHVEIQGEKDPDLEKRMFVYHYRIFDCYGKRVSSLALLADTDAGWRPSDFGYELWGCGLRFWFPAVKILDFAGRKVLRGSLSNPFAVAVEAHLKAKATRHDMEQRLTIKWSIVRSLYQVGYGRATILELVRFIDWIMTLPPELEDRFRSDLLKFEEKSRMPFLCNIERNALQKGEEIGKKKGEEIGEKKGEKKARVEFAQRLLARGETVESVAELTGLSPSEIRKLAVTPNRVEEPTTPYASRKRKKLGK